jgi:hypothetical protein
MKERELLDAVQRAAALQGGWATPRQVQRYLPGASLGLVQRRLGVMAKEEKIVRALHERRVRYRPRLTPKGD